MKIAILSDIHDNIFNLRAALPAMAHAEVMLFCGDLCSPFVVNLLAEGFPGPIHIILGNNDGDGSRIAQNAAQCEEKRENLVKVRGEFADLPASEFGKHIFVNHYPKIAHSIAASGEFDIVCYGHDHQYYVARHERSKTLLINPGTLMGYDPIAGQDVTPTFIILDTVTREVTRYEVNPPPGVASGAVKS
jgi:putative phosphoesterase